MFFQKNSVKVGADKLAENSFNVLKGKHVGVITNHSAILSDGLHIADALNKNNNFKIMAFFGPEHGIRGDSPDGIKISHEDDPKTKIKIYSLYGKINKPTPEMLDGVDALLYDIQDIGARFYTYISTLFLAMEAAAEKGIEFIILDRPNPISGLSCEGPILDPEFKSFVGLFPLPITHGLTAGELAHLVNSEGWLNGGCKADLKVIKMDSWKRGLWYNETGLQWVKPSPNMATLKTAVVYPGTCLFEGTNISEGRGTNHPFEIVGAPFIKGSDLAKEMNTKKLEGVVFKPIRFTPKIISNITSSPKYPSEQCEGIFLEIADRNIFEPVKTALHLICTIKEMYPAKFAWRPRSKTTGHFYFDLLCGTDKIRTMTDSGSSAAEILSLDCFNMEGFAGIKEKYLLY